MPQSLHRTWAALALAAAAVLFVALLVGRDFVADVAPECPSSVEPTLTHPAERTSSTSSSGGLALVPVYFVSTDPDPDLPIATHGFQLRYDTSVKRGTTVYSNVRIASVDIGADKKPCGCGSIPVELSGEAPYDLRLFRFEGTDQYVVKGRTSGAQYIPTDERVSFALLRTPSRHLQTDRIFTQRHLSGLVVLIALGALGVALLRSRRAMSYALRIHTWTAARLTQEGMIESETGTTIGTLDSGRVGRVAPGPILVAPSALSTSGLYRDMPIVAHTSVAEGTHARWASGTMQRLRDARVLAVLSTMCTVLAFGARLIA